MLVLEEKTKEVNPTPSKESAVETNPPRNLHLTGKSRELSKQTFWVVAAKTALLLFLSLFRKLSIDCEIATLHYNIT